MGGRCVPLSRDHKPILEEECERIEAAGGWVESNRVNGHLALSRALGDFMFKQNICKLPEEQIVTGKISSFVFCQRFCFLISDAFIVEIDKKFSLAALPEVRKLDVTEDWEFVVLACDGIWDVMTNEEVIEFVRPRIAEAKSVEEICEDLLAHCLAPDTAAGAGCDNMTVILVCFLHGKPYEDLVSRCQRPVSAEES